MFKPNYFVPKQYSPISLTSLSFTDLLDLRPLPVTALGDMNLAALYKFSHFNPVQTQIFHTVYHTDSNVLLGGYL